MQPYKVTKVFLTKVCPREGFPSRKYFLTKASSRNVNPLHRNTRLAGCCHGMPLCLAPQSRNVCHGSLSSQISPHEGFSSRKLFHDEDSPDQVPPHEGFPTEATLTNTVHVNLYVQGSLGPAGQIQEIVFKGSWAQNSHD